MRSAIAHRHAETLGTADRDVGAELARRNQQRQRQQIASHDRQSALLLHRGDGLTVVAHGAARTRIVQKGTERGGAFEILERIADHDLEAERPGARSQNGQRLRMTVGIDEERLGPGLARPLRHRHRLGGSGRLVEQRGIGKLQAGEVLDHMLEVEQRLEAALADLGLIRRVGRVPARIFQHVAQDHRWRVGAVVAHSDHRGQDTVARRVVLQRRERLVLVDRGRQRQWAFGSDQVRRGLVDQPFERIDANLTEHLLDLGVVRTNVAGDKGPRRLQLGKRWSGHGILTPLRAQLSLSTKAP